MALTAAITLNPSSTITKDKVIQALVTISNDDTSNPVTISQIVPKTSMSGDSTDNGNQSSTIQECRLGPSPIVPIQVGMTAGVASFQFPVSFHAPSDKFTDCSVGALIYAADGQVVESTPASITVTNP